jgi:hypothetical protein
VVLYTFAVIPIIHAFTAGELIQRIVISLLMIFPCGLMMGFCFPIGMRRLSALRQERHLPWMWALNGAAGTLGSFLAILISMDTSVSTCALAGAACYLVAAAALPRGTLVRKEQQVLVHS